MLIKASLLPLLLHLPRYKQPHTASLSNAVYRRHLLWTKPESVFALVDSSAGYLVSHDRANTFKPRPKTTPTNLTHTHTQDVHLAVERERAVSSDDGHRWSDRWASKRTPPQRRG